MEEKGELAQRSKRFHHLDKRSPGDFRNVHRGASVCPQNDHHHTKETRQGCWLELGQSGNKATRTELLGYHAFFLISMKANCSKC